MKAFLDTNILVYAHDPRDVTKRDRCRDLIRTTTSARHAVISTQVMQECYQCLYAKIHLPQTTARTIVVSLPHLCEVVQMTTDLLVRGLDLHQVHQVSFWDGLIIAAALHAECGVLWSEDLQDGRLIDGLRIRNPFRDA